MVQRKPEEQVTFDQVLKLVKHLTPEAQEELVQEMKLQWLRNAIEEGEDSLKQGGIPAEEVFRRLEERNAQVRKKGASEKAVLFEPGASGPRRDPRLYS